jgi:hypothetical protein
MDLPPIITVECYTVVIGSKYLMQCTLNARRVTEIISKNGAHFALKMNFVLLVLYENARGPVLTDCNCLIQCAVKMSNKTFFFIL